MYNFVQGGSASDERGEIRFVNNFDMSLVKRFYIITNRSTEIIRGWRGHKIEDRWFFVIEGSFKVDLVYINDWSNPSRDLNVISFTIHANDNKVLHIPKGYATTFQQEVDNSKLLVFANFGIENSENDNYTWDSAYFVNR